MRVKRTARRTGRLLSSAMLGILYCASQGWLSAATNDLRIYGRQETMQRNAQYQSYVSAVFEYDLKGQLPPTEQDALADVRITLPTDDLVGDPISVGTAVSDREVIFPIQSVAFLDDLAALAGWLSSHDCSFEPAALYSGMLVSKPPPSGHEMYPNPREAFGLTDSVWDDPYIKKVSNQVFKTAVYFILAHELGHIREGHEPYGSEGLSLDAAQQQELEADNYALNAMRHIGVPPEGMFHFFTVRSRIEGNVPGTHPLSGERLIQIARALEESPSDFVPPNESKSYWAPIIQDLGRRFRLLIPVIDNPSLRAQLRQQEEAADWDELAQSCS